MHQAGAGDRGNRKGLDAHELGIPEATQARPAVTEPVETRPVRGRQGWTGVDQFANPPAEDQWPVRHLVAISTKALSSQRTTASSRESPPTTGGTAQKAEPPADRGGFSVPAESRDGGRYGSQRDIIRSARRWSGHHLARKDPQALRPSIPEAPGGLHEQEGLGVTLTQR